MMTIKTYRDLSRLKSFDDRFKFLKLTGVVGEATFGYDRILNQLLYRSSRWRKSRDKVIIRDNGCDLGVDGFEIHDKIIVHHINPITIEDIEEDVDELYDPEFLISTAFNTHNAIHFGDESLLPKKHVERFRNDTCPWKI